MACSGRRFFLCVAFALALGASAHAIVGGTIVTDPKPWSVKVTTADSICSGSLVAQQWVLTAGHCTLDLSTLTRSRLATIGGLPQLPATAFTLYVGGSGKKHAFKVDRVETAALRGVPDDRIVDDLGLLHLAEPVPGTWAPLPLAPRRATVPAGAPVTFWGYGSSKAPPYLALRTTRPGDWAVDASCAGIGNACYVHPKGPSFPAAGDSGAPIASYVNGSWVQRGIFTGPGPRSDLTVPPQYGADVVAHLAWIRRVTGLPAVAPGTVLHDPATGASWLVDDDGFRHAIARPAVSACLTAAGALVRDMPTFTARSVPEDHTAAAACS